MPPWLRHVDGGSRALAYLLGGAVLLLAVAAAGSDTPPAALIDWLKRIFGPTYLLLTGALVLAALYCLVRLGAAPSAGAAALWLRGGVQAANGITTLALTYTLLGISLGIGTLAEQPLTPDTVQAVIGELVEKFSLAFMTTVVGMPLAAVLRGLIVITHARRASGEA